MNFESVCPSTYLLSCLFSLQNLVPMIVYLAESILKDTNCIYQRKYWCLRLTLTSAILFPVTKNWVNFAPEENHSSIIVRLSILNYNHEKANGKINHTNQQQLPKWMPLTRKRTTNRHMTFSPAWIIFLIKEEEEEDNTTNTTSTNNRNHNDTVLMLGMTLYICTPVLFEISSVCAGHDASKHRLGATTSRQSRARVWDHFQKTRSRMRCDIVKSHVLRPVTS